MDSPHIITSSLITRATQLKEEGNNLFKGDKFPEALLRYQMAVDSIPTTAEQTDVKEVQMLLWNLHSNVVACFVKLEKWDEVVKACEPIIGVSIMPNSVYHRRCLYARAKAYTALNLPRKSLDDYFALKRFSAMPGSSFVVSEEIMNQNIQELETQLHDVDLQWTRISDTVPFKARYYHLAVLDEKSEFLYVHGGSNGSLSYLSDMWALDLRNHTWKEVKTSGPSPPPTAHQTGVMYQDHLYLFCGIMLQKQPWFWKLNLTTRKWTSLARTSPPVWRTGHSAHVYKGKMYIYGGEKSGHESSDFSTSDMCIYDFATEKWVIHREKKGVTPPGRRKHGAWIHKNYLWVFGGEHAIHNYLKDLWRYDFDTGVWEEMTHKCQGELPVARAESEAATFTNQNVTFFGGYVEDFYGSKYFDNAIRLAYHSKSPPTWHASVTQKTSFPSMRAGHTLTTDESRGQAILIGGYNGFSMTPMIRSDVWTLKLAKQSSMHTCAKCQKRDFCNVCGRCRKVHYCSTTCQRSDWPNHKAQCTPTGK